MALPIVAIAGKALLQWVSKKFADSDQKPLIIGAVVGSLAFGFIVPIIVLGSLISGIVGGSSADPCTLQNAGFGVGSTSLRVMEWNVCSTSCPNWEGRAQKMAGKIAAAAPDVVVLTEAGHGERLRSVTFKMMSGIGYKNALKQGPFKGQYVFYNSDAFTSMRSGHYATDNVNYGATWAELRNNTSGAQVIVAGVHIDYRSSDDGNTTRQRQMESLKAQVDKANSASLPVIWAGDFNASQHYRGREKPIPFMLQTHDDAAEIAATKIATDKSSARGRDGDGVIKNGSPIDHIFVPKGLQVSSFENVLRTKGDGFITDHNPIIAAVGIPGGVDAGGTPSAGAVEDIPAVALQAYQKAAAATGVDWSYIAAIGKIETNHGRSASTANGAVSAADANGDVRPIIRNTIGASGPMQFMPATWRSYQQDGNFDGMKSVDNLFDAALGTGRYLARSGAPNDMRKAIFAYNHAEWYVDDVIAQAKKYSAAGGPPNVMLSAAELAQATPAGAPVTDAASTGGSSWVRPVKGGPISARFGQTGEMWSLGYHTGTDFVVPTGTPVFAAQAGSVSVSHPGWAGNLITIDHGQLDGNNIKSQYAHVSKVVVSSGTVAAGDLIAFSGALGNITGPHLHFEVLVNGKYANPESYLAGAGTPIYVGGPSGESGQECGDMVSVGDEDQNTEWDGFKNGRIPDTSLCAVDAYAGGKLRCDAAKSLNTLNAEYKKKFNTGMPVAVTYRSYEQQVNCKARNPSCDKAGSSRFGFGLVVKFKSPLSDTSSNEFKWMSEKGVGAGWVETNGAWEFGKKTT